MNPTITAEYIRSIFFYDPLTGQFVYLAKTVKCGKDAQWNGRLAGKVAGHITASGYIVIQIHRRPIPAHRLAWLYHFGEWPKEQIDHIDRTKTNNAISNLRVATASQNAANRVTPVGSSKLRGVTWHGKAQKWQAQIGVDGKMLYLGLFTDPSKAAIAYRSAAIIFHGRFVPSVTP